MENGWIKIHRKLWDNPIAQKPEYAWLWITLLSMANHDDTLFIWNNKKQTLKRGQLLTGRKTLSKKTRISESKVYNILKYLENEQQIKQQKTNKFTIVTIVNWDRYQQNEQQNKQQTNNKQTTNEQQVNTYKNVKNEKNIKQSSKEDSAPVEAKVVKRSDKRIDECLDYFRERLGNELDDTVLKNRRYCYLTLSKLKKMYPEKSEVGAFKVLVDLGLKDKFHSRNTTCARYIYYNINKLIASFKGARKEVVKI